MKSGVCGLLLIACMAVGCGERQSEYGEPEAVQAYLGGIRGVLQELRGLDQEIAAAVSADTMDADVIVPLIEERFRPALAGIQQRASGLTAADDLASVQRELMTYLELRLRAFDLAIQGRREGRPELFDEFTRLQIQADRLGRRLERSVTRLRASLR